MQPPTSVHRLDPSLALRDGTADAWAVLLLWCYRKSWLPLFLAGWLIATLAGWGDRVAEAVADARDAAATGLTGGLLSPLAGVILGLFVRLTAGVFALAFAYPLSRWLRPDGYPAGNRVVRWLRHWTDRFRLTRAYQELRWSWPVRNQAARRLGVAGRRLMWCSTIALWATVVLVVLLVVVVPVALIG